MQRDRFATLDSIGSRIRHLGDGLLAIGVTFSGERVLIVPGHLEMFGFDVPLKS
jgi:hypothetical protein